MLIIYECTDNVNLDELDQAHWYQTHFISDLVEDKVITLEPVKTRNQLTDIFTKALDALQFKQLRRKLGVCMWEEL